MDTRTALSPWAETAPNWSSTLSERIYERVREMIIHAELKPGEKLTSGHLAQMFGVSSTPIREALRMLEQSCLVEIIPHRGAIVRPVLSAKQAQDIYTVRLALEQLAVRLIVARGDEVDWRELRQVAELYAVASEKGNFRDALQWDLEFHGALVRASGNQVLAETNSRLENQIQMVRSLDRGAPRWIQAIKDHQTIIDALLRQDVDAAIAALSNHITAGQRYVVGIVNDSNS
jgi:DNA-binding GntR family transcriptional regulator